ncbi:MAG: hypothetical protein EXR68_01620 [Dehalococcoidia bacterium]|nr:hypothetical protein [Dehalococcoidia bacterium]
MTTVTERRARDSSELLFICDFSPPRGANASALEPARTLGADFVCVAYNPGKTARVNSAFAAQWIRAHTGAEVVFTLATRDINRLAAQSLLLGAALLGLENVLVLQGDRFSARELESVKSVDDFRPTGLLRAIGEMNAGLDYRGGKLQAPTSLCAGATIDLGHDPERELALTRRKVQSGAHFLLMQPLFEPAPLERFLARYAERYGEPLLAPLFCGVQVLASDSPVFGHVPRRITDQLAQGRAGAEIALEVLQRFTERGVRSIYLVPPILRGGRRDYEAARGVIAAARA